MSPMLKKLIDLADKLDAYGFECEAGPLINCVDWQEFKKGTIKHMHKNSGDGTDGCDYCGHDLRHYVHK